jgi:hypothetical protein
MKVQLKSKLQKKGSEDEVNLACAEEMQTIENEGEDDKVLFEDEE